MVCFLFVDFSSPEEYLELLLWKLITSALLQAFVDLLRPSKQLRQFQRFGNIATTLTIKKDLKLVQRALPAEEGLQE